MIENDSIFQAIKSAGISSPTNIKSFSPLNKILWLLKIAKDNSPASALSVEAISYLAYKILEENIPDRSVKNILAPAGNAVMKKENKFYEITRQGREKLKEVEIDALKKIQYITGETPWTDRNSQFPEFANNLKGDLLILDPYYGLGCLHVLSKLNKTQKIKFLSGQLGGRENQVIFSKELMRFKREFPKTELKVFQNSQELHDRYIISDNFLVIIGHGIKDMGDKECFMIAIACDQVPEIVKNLREKFDERWKVSTDMN